MGDLEFENPHVEVDENQHSEDETDTILMSNQGEDTFAYYEAKVKQAATSTSVVDSSQAEKTLSIKDTGISFFTVPDNTIQLFKDIQARTDSRKVKSKLDL